MMNTFPYKPAPRDVVFELEIKESSIYLTQEQANQKALKEQMTVKLVAVGDEVNYYKPNDLVLLRSQRFLNFAINQKEYGQISSGELLGIVEPNTDTTLTPAMIKREQITNLDASLVDKMRVI